MPADHTTGQRVVGASRPLLEEACHRRKRPVGVSWRMDETSIKVKGQWRIYRTMDRHARLAIKSFIINYLKILLSQT